MIRRSMRRLRPIGAAEHPGENEYIREFCPGEFGAAELPEIPSGFRYATLVTVIHRIGDVADGGHRCMIAVWDASGVQRVE